MTRPRSNQYVSFVLDRTRAACRQNGYRRSTEDRYLYWVHRFLHDFEVVGPGDLQPQSARAFLGTLREYSSPTRRQARNALRFLFEEVLVGPIGGRIVLPGAAVQDRGEVMPQAGVSVGAEVRSQGNRIKATPSLWTRFRAHIPEGGGPIGRVIGSKSSLERPKGVPLSINGPENGSLRTFRKA